MQDLRAVLIGWLAVGRATRRSEPSEPESESMTVQRIARSGILRAALAVAALGYIASRVQWNDLSGNQPPPITISDAAVNETTSPAPASALGLKSIWQQSRKPMLLAAIGMFFLVPMFQAIRLRWMESLLRGWVLDNFFFEFYFKPFYSTCLFFIIQLNPRNFERIIPCKRYFHF